MALIKRSRARVSDVAGFVFFAAFSVTFFLRSPEMSVLLVPMIGKELFTALTFLIRERPQAAVGTFQARFAAYADSRNTNPTSAGPGLCFPLSSCFGVRPLLLSTRERSPSAGVAKSQIFPVESEPLARKVAHN